MKNEYFFLLAEFKKRFDLGYFAYFYFILFKNAYFAYVILLCKLLMIFLCFSLVVHQIPNDK